MDRKLKDLIKPDENALLDAVCASAHQIWQAGLGAFSRAQQEGGDLFDKLVQEGGELQKLTGRLSGEKGFSVTDAVSRLAGNASRQASGSLDKLERIFEERVSRSLRDLGVPSHQDVQALNRDMAELKAALRTAAQHAQEEIDALRRTVAGLQGASGTVEKTPAPSKAPKKSATKSANKAAARPAAKATRPAAKAAPSAPARASARRTVAQPPAAKKTARSGSGAG